MIWQLMKRDPTWKIGTVMMGGMFAIIATALEFLPVHQPFREAFLAGFGFTAAGSAALAFSILPQLTLYEAALPIAGRDAWLSRVLSLLALIWLPVLTAMLIGSALGFPPLLPFLQASAIFTVLVLAAKCVRIRVLGGAPQRLSAALFPVPFLAGMGMAFARLVVKHHKSASWFVLPPTGIVLTICSFASAALFAWGWVNVPKSFQIATAQSRSDRRSETKEPSEFTWAPVFRPIYGTSTIVVLILWMVILFLEFATENLYFVFVFTAVFALSGSSQVLRQCSWLLGLPVSPRRVFGWFMIPPTAAVLVPGLAAILIDTKLLLSPNTQMLEMAAELAFFYGLIFLNELSVWRRLSKFRATRWGPLTVWTPLAGMIAPVFLFHKTGVFERLAGVLPGTWWQLACILAIPVIATYWLAEKAFREQEYRPSLILNR